MAVVMPSANCEQIQMISLERPPDFVMTPKDPSRWSLQDTRLSNAPPITPSRHSPADTMPIAEGPLKVLPSLRACCASSFASRSGTPSVIIETSWIFGSLSASMPAAQARSAPMYTRLVLICGWVAVASDRKSTRLNSSHLVISYAVFCLKKKKILHDKTICDIWLLDSRTST